MARGRKMPRSGLKPGNSDLMVEEFVALRQVDTNIEMVWRQQAMKDLHVKYPKQRGLHIILSSEKNCFPSLNFIFESSPGQRLANMSVWQIACTSLTQA